MNAFRSIVSGTNIVRKIVQSRIANSRMPLIAFFLITNRCNLKCYYCYPMVFKRQVDDFTTEEIFKIIDELAERGTQMVTLVGGEPLLRDDIGEIIDYLNEKSIISEMVTNGFLVKKRIKEIKNIDSVCVSIDGEEKENDLNRGEGSYKKALEAIEILRANDVNLRLHGTVTRNSINTSCEHLLQLAQKYGAFVTWADPATFSDGPDSGLSNEEIRDFYKKVMKYKKQGYPIIHSEPAIEYTINWPYPYGHKIKKNDPLNGFRPVMCKRDKLSIYIDADGTVYPCTHLWRQFGLNLREVGLQKAFDNLETRPCVACCCIGDIEWSMILSLNMKSIMQAGRYFVKGKTGFSLPF